MDKVYRGQVFTPERIATKMVRVSKKYLKKDNLLILDPCCGHGIFPKALDKLIPDYKIKCIDIDSGFCKETKNYFKNRDIDYEICNLDYIQETNLKKSFDFIISNPPYVRQENISKKDKDRYIDIIKKELGITLSRKSNLFIYFLLKNIIDLQPGGIGCTIVFDTIDKSKYSQDFLKVFNKYCEILYEENLSQPFESVLIDAKIILFRKRIILDLELNPIPKIKIDNGFEEFGNQFLVSRGLGLKSKKTFEVKKENKYFNYAKEIILNAKHIGDDSQIKYLSKALIFNKEEKIPDEISNYLKERYFSLHKKQINGLTHEYKLSGLLMNYFYRDRPKFITNPKKYIASDNFYLIKHKKLNPDVCKTILSSDPFIDRIIENSRNLGNGLKKIQIYELKETIIPDLSSIPKLELKKFSSNILKYKNDKSSLLKLLEEYLNC